MLYQKTKWLTHLAFQFSAKKKVSDYSLGGEDGLEETPLISETPERYAGTPAWSEVSFLSQYRLKENTLIRIALDNIFDIHYREFASGISAPGRNLKIGLNYSF